MDMEVVRQFDGKVVYVEGINYGRRGLVYEGAIYSVRTGCDFGSADYVELEILEPREINKIEELKNPTKLERAIAQALVSGKDEIWISLPLRIKS